MVVEAKDAGAKLPALTIVQNWFLEYKRKATH